MKSRTIAFVVAALATTVLGAEDGRRSRITEDWGHKKTEHVDEDTSPRKARVIVVPAIIGDDVKNKFLEEISEVGRKENSTVFDNPNFTTFLIDALVNTRKLDVLEREELLTVAKELDFAESDYVDPEKVARLGKMLNADYTVIPEIRYLSVGKRSNAIPYLPKKRTIRFARIWTAVRTVDVRTSRIVTSNIAEYEYVNRDRDDPVFSGAKLRDTLTMVYRKASRAEAAVVVDHAYPIRVLKVAGNKLTINRGTGAIVKGEHLAVYERGELMVDPDTKEAMGYHEAEVGKAIVEKVSGKTAIAAVTSSDAPIKEGYICRRVEAPEVQPLDAPVSPLD